jgi:hypothetical protein
MSVSSGLGGPGAGGGGAAAGLAAAQAAQAAARDQATGLGAGLGTLAAVILAGFLYAYLRRRSSAKDASAKALSSSAEKGDSTGGGVATGADGAAAQAGKFDLLNPFVKGAKDRTLREHGEGKRLGRTAWSPEPVRDQDEAQPASPQGPEAAGSAVSRSSAPVRGTALAGNNADPLPQVPYAQQEEASMEEGAAVGVSVRELADGEGEGSGEGQEGDVEQTLQLSSLASTASAATVAGAAASPPPFSPPGPLTARAALGRTPGATSRLAPAAAASDTKQGLQPLEVTGGSSGSGERGGAYRHSPVSVQPGPALGTASSHFSFLPLPPPLPPGRGGGARARGSAAGLNFAVPPPLPAQAAPLARGMAWATDNPMLRRASRGER